MKRYFLLLMALAAMLFHSCRGDEPRTPADGKGALSVSYLVADADGNTIECSRSSMNVVIKGPENRTLRFPDNGLIEGLPAGDYTVQVCTHPGGMPAPGLECPCYSGTATATVEAAKTVDVKVNCTLNNSGIVFEYHKSLADAGFSDIVMTVRQGDARIEFGGDDSKKCGYFKPGSVDITMRNGDRELRIAGEAVHTRELAAGKIYRMTASLHGVVLTVSIEEVSDPTRSEELTVDDGGISVPDHILTTIKTCTVRWDPKSSDPVPFDLCVLSDDGRTELWIRGFTKAPAGDTFYLADGIYHASGMEGASGSDYGTAMTFAPGHHTSESYMPTTGFRWSTDLLYIDDAYYGEQGVISVRRTGDEYLISADLTGDADIWTGWKIETKHDVRKIYQIKLPAIKWINTYPVEGDIEYDDIPLGTYNASGTNIFYDNDGERGPASWSGSISQSTYEGMDLWRLSKWSDVESGFFLEYKYKRLWIAPVYDKIIDEHFALRLGVAYINKDGAARIYVVPAGLPGPEVRFDKATNTIDFSQEHFTGAVMGVCGILDYHATGRDCYLATDIYVDAKVVITPSPQGGPTTTFHPGIVIRVPEAAKRLPLKADMIINAEGGYPIAR